jgi:autoinducer 2 (AI-2) kinase
MGRRYLLGLDAGGSGGRALLFDPQDGSMLTATRSWSHAEAPGTAGFGYDLDLQAVWAHLAAATREVVERADPRDEILGIAASAMRFALVVVDKEGQSLLALPNRDGRAAAEALEIRAKVGDQIHARTGLWPAPIMTLPRLLWFARHHEEAWQQAHKVLSLGDWVAFRLCGELATDATQAGETLLFDLQTRDWSWDCLDEPELPQHLLPKLRAAGTQLGALTPEAAQALGLRAGTPVATGGADTQCGLLASGAAEPGDVGVVAGSTAPVQLVSSEPLVTDRTWSGHHLIEGRWVLESNGGIMGETLAWFASLFFPGAPDPVARALAEAARAHPGAGGVLSSLGAEVMRSSEMQLPVGHLSLSPWALPDPVAARADLARAVLEGMAFAVEANIAQVQPDAPPGGELHLAGGMSRSPFWAQLLADVSGRSVVSCAAAESTALGAALCAGAATGVYPSLSDAANAAGARARRFEPDRDSSAMYDDHRAAWSRLTEAHGEADDVVRSRAIPQVLHRASQSDAPSRAADVQPRILATADLDDQALEALGALGEVEHASFRAKMRLLTGRSLISALEGFQVFITEVDVVDAGSLAKLPDLRVIAACRGDAVNVDLTACTAYGIPVLHAPGRNADAVADLTLAFFLMLARKLPEATGFLREPGGEEGDMGRMGKAFGQLRGRELWRKTVGLVGFGAVGQGVARRLAGFHAHVVVHDPFVPDDVIVRAGADPVSLQALLQASDFVSLHCGVSEGTRELIGAEELALMRPGACLVNTARAALVSESALVDALREGHLAGAAVDVFPVEPPGADHPLLALESVIATPHVGGNTMDVGAHQGQIVADELGRLLRGERPRHVLNPEALDVFDWSQPRLQPAPEVLARLEDRPAPTVSDTQRAPAPKAAEPPAATPSAAPPAVREGMERILGGFVERIARDDALAAFASDQDVTLHFVLTDLGLEIFIRLRGSVETGLGAPDPPADVQLRMKADVLDGMFTGRVNAMQSAMDGNLSFTGDTVKAMALQQMQRDLARLYRAAREEAGDPGDLASLADPGGAAAAAAVPGSDDVREGLVRVVGELYAQELITATGGNVSVRVPGQDELWITPSQLFKGDLRPDSLVRVGLEGQPLSEGRAPSSERMMHCALYRRPEVQAVVHAHAAHATILANAGLPFLPISTEAAFFSDLPRVPFIMPGTDALAEAVAEAMGSGWAVLMQNHGLIVAGRSLRRAADMVEIIERSAQVILGCYAVGREPPTLPEDVVEKLRVMGDLIA